jgi:hypothetical protein
MNFATLCLDLLASRQASRARFEFSLRTARENTLSLSLSLSLGRFLRAESKSSREVGDRSIAQSTSSGLHI